VSEVLEQPEVSHEELRRQQRLAGLAKARAVVAHNRLGKQKPKPTVAEVRRQLREAEDLAAAATMEMQALTAKPQTATEKAVSEGAIPENFGIVEVGPELLTGDVQTLGKFAPPRGFDLKTYSIAWRAKEPGTLGVWESVAEAEQPMPIQGTNLTFPGWRLYRYPDGRLHSLKMGNGELVMMFTLRTHWDQINKATAAISKQRGKALEAKIAQSTLVLPVEVRQQQLLEEERMKAEFLQMQKMAESTS
jgi:hypothetical protein